MKTFVLRSEGQIRGLEAFIKSNWLSFAQKESPLQVLITEYKAKRNHEQNKLMWAVLGEISANAWVGGKRFSAEAWHENFKREFIGIEELPSGDTKGISTTTLNVSQFAQYVTRIQAYATTELGVEFA